MTMKVVITGASSGIGKATAARWAARRCELVLLARREAVLAEQAREWTQEYGNPIHVFELDVRDRAAVERVAGEVMATIGAPDVLVNNAGLARETLPYQENTWADIEEMIDTNIKGLASVTRAFLPAMLARNAGHIINLGSTAGQFAYGGGAVYCATKAAVKMLSDGIRIDTVASDIKVTTVMPGLVETPFSEVRFRGDRARAAQVYAGVEALTADDIAEVIEFVATRPRRVQITDITIMANQQATGFTIHREQD